MMAEADGMQGSTVEWSGIEEKLLAAEDRERERETRQQHSLPVECMLTPT